jgi:acyl-CoA reductase-like NAD-dependent aldehyde dehydrogenase
MIIVLAEVLRQTELPAGVMNIIFGDGPGTGSTLIRSRRIQGVSFTGGTETRIQIRKDTAADIVKHLCLDIRGSSPTLVFGDVEIEQGASAAAYAAFENSGQLCRSGSVIYVHRSIYNLFLHKLKTHVQDKYRLHLELGPVVSKERYAKIRSLLIQAREENAMFVTGEIPKEVPKNGFWVSPTVLSNVRTNSRLAREGILGPVAVVCPFDDEEAVRLCNDNPNAVGAVVLTDDLRRMRRVIGHLNAGLMWANCCLGREFGAGFNDIRATGLGREGGERSRDEFTKLQIMHFPAY